MSARDKLRSFAASRSPDTALLPPGAFSYGDARELMLEQVCLSCIEDVPLSKASTESIEAELIVRALRSPGYVITAEEKDILDAAKELECKPVRAIVDDREDSEDRGASVPAPTGMMTIGGMGRIQKICQAVIRWRAAMERDG